LIPAAALVNGRPTLHWPHSSAHKLDHVVKERHSNFPAANVDRKVLRINDLRSAKRYAGASRVGQCIGGNPPVKFRRQVFSPLLVPGAAAKVVVSIKVSNSRVSQDVAAPLTASQCRRSALRNPLMTRVLQNAAFPSKSRQLVEKHVRSVSKGFCGSHFPVPEGLRASLTHRVSSSGSSRGFKR
jgi:hypothetical protein